MSDYYTEQLVKKRPDAKDLAIKTGLIVLTVLTVLIVFIFPVGLILPILAIVLDVIMFRRLNVEYEYLYVNGDLDIDHEPGQEKENVFHECIRDGASGSSGRTGTASLSAGKGRGLYFRNRTGQRICTDPFRSRRTEESDF